MWRRVVECALTISLSYQVRAASVFPTLLPTLTVSPISAFNARALASLVTVAGNALSKRLTTVLTPLVKSMESEKDEKIVEAVDEAVRALLASIEDEEGLHSLLITLLGWCVRLGVTTIIACRRSPSFPHPQGQGQQRKPTCHRLQNIRHILRGSG